MNITNVLNYTNYYLVGIKGVAMTSIAQVLLDAGKSVSGSDVAENFVTQDILTERSLHCDIGFETPLPLKTECIIYTSAHQAENNSQVQEARKLNIPTYSQAEALAAFFNQKKGIAVCGVGGKSSTSAMITWILEQTGQNPSYSVGVGRINQLPATGRWNTKGEFFVAEADEYVTDPAARQKSIPITPRFSYLLPQITVCTKLAFDHPDVYDDFDHTKDVFSTFFQQIAADGHLILNQEDLDYELPTSAKNKATFGTQTGADFMYDFQPKNQEAGKTTATVTHQGKEYQITLKVPGKFNVANAVCALAACYYAGVPLTESIAALASFSSTKRRFEHIGTKRGITYYDDYAHHPSELAATITALHNWYPNTRCVIAFQPHTYSRTKQLLHEFIHALGKAKEVYLLDIFASAREQFDSTISSDDIVRGVQKKFPSVTIKNLHSITELAQLCNQLEPPCVVITLGAGDIYHVHEHIQNREKGHNV